MDTVQESIVNEEIENALRESPISATWSGVTTLNIEDPRSESWRRFKERLSGVAADQWVVQNCDSDVDLNRHETGSESLIFKEVSSLILQTFNSLFPNGKAIDLNDENISFVTVDEILNAFIESTDNNEVMTNSIFIDVIVDPIVKKFSEKIGEVGKCCTTEWLRSKSKIVPLNDICGKRTDLGGIIDWVMKRYGGSRRESCLYVTLMWWVAWFTFINSGRFGMKLAMDSCIGGIPASILEQNTASDGDRLSHTVDKMGLANAVKDSANKSLSTSARLRLAIESVVTARRAYAKKKYNELYEQVSITADPKTVTPIAYLKSRYVDGTFSFAMDLVLSIDFGDAFDVMAGSIYLAAIESSLHYNDLCDAVMDMKYMETHNYVICAKVNSNYSFSDHCEALYIALTTFDKSCSSYDDRIKRRMCQYRFGGIVFYGMWPRYRAVERARRYVGGLNKKERDNLIERGRKCIQGDVYIEENIWLDAICPNYNNRRAVIRKRGYTQTLLFVLGVEDDPSAQKHVYSAVKAIGMRPFDTALELVTSLGSVWLAKLALRSVKESVSYDNLVAELTDLLTTLSLSSSPLNSDNTITPCESIVGPLCLRLCEMLALVSKINTIAGEAIVSTVASVITMVSLEPFRCVAQQADMLLLAN